MMFFSRTQSVIAIALLVAAGSASAQVDVQPPQLPSVWKTIRKEGRVIISPDGKTIAVIDGNNGWATFYPRDSKWSLLTTSNYSSSVFFYTSDGKSVLTAVRPTEQKQGPRGLTIGVYDPTTAKKVRTFELLPQHGGNCLYATGGRILVAVTRDNIITAYDHTTGKCLGDFEDKEHRPWYMALSADGKWLLSAGAKAETTTRNQLRVWDVEKRKLFCELHDFGDHDKITAIAISRDGKWCAVTVGRRVWVFDRENRTEMGRITVFTSPDGELLFAPDGETLLILGEACHHGVNVWDWRKSKDVRGGTPIMPKNLNERAEKEFFKKHNVATLSDASIANDGTLLTRSTKGEIRLWTFLNTKPKDTDPEPAKKDKAKK